MRIISDLTKDTRPTLEEMLVEAIKDTVHIDSKKEIDNIDLIEYENHTFYYRVVYLFMQRSVLYYDNVDIEKWSKEKLLKEAVLPEVYSLAEEIRMRDSLKNPPLY